MINKCSVVGYFTNYSGCNKGTVFPLHQDEDQKRKWIMFLNRRDYASMKNIFICFKHFAEEVISNTYSSELSCRQNWNLSQQLYITQKIAIYRYNGNFKTPRKAPTERILQNNQLIDLKNKDTIIYFKDIVSKFQKNPEKWLTFDRKEKFLLIHTLEPNEDNNVPQVTYCIREEDTLHVRLFYKKIPIALPNGFCKGRNTILISCNMLERLINHIKLGSERRDSMLSELQQWGTPNALTFQFVLRLVSLPRATFPSLWFRVLADRCSCLRGEVDWFRGLAVCMRDGLSVHRQRGTSVNVVKS